MIAEQTKPPGVAAPPGEGAPEVPVQRLTRAQFWACLTIALTLFLFATGPVWAHPWNMNILDVAIYVSYLPIPILVIGCLAWRRALNFRGAFLDILEITLIKYGITFTIALVLWMVVKEPVALRGRVAGDPLVPRDTTAQEPLPPPSIIAPEQTGTLLGVAHDESGRPLAEALIYVDSGLEAYVFAPPKEPVSLENNGAGVVPRLAAAQVGQPILARSTDGHLHTFVAASRGSALLNVPLISSGSWTPVGLRGAGLIATLTCSVHQRQGNEAPAYLGVFAHPFFAITGADGKFRFAGVPAGALRLGGFHRERGTVQREVRLDAGGSADLVMAFPSPSPAN